MADGIHTLNRGAERTTGEITRDILDNASELIRSEIQLAKTELKAEAKQAGKAGGLFAAGALLAFYGAAALVACCIILLAMALPLWFAALVMGIILLVAAGILAMAGKQKWNQLKAPVQTMESLKDDAQWLKHRTI